MAPIVVLLRMMQLLQLTKSCVSLLGSLVAWVKVLMGHLLAPAELQVLLQLWEEKQTDVPEEAARQAAATARNIWDIQFVSALAHMEHSHFVAHERDIQYLLFHRALSESRCARLAHREGELWCRLAILVQLARGAAKRAQASAEFGKAQVADLGRKERKQQERLAAMEARLRGAEEKLARQGATTAACQVETKEARLAVQVLREQLAAAEARQELSKAAMTRELADVEARVAAAEAQAVGAATECQVAEAQVADLAEKLEKAEMDGDVAAEEARQLEKMCASLVSGNKEHAEESEAMAAHCESLREQLRLERQRSRSLEAENRTLRGRIQHLEEQRMAETAEFQEMLSKREESACQLEDYLESERLTAQQLRTDMAQVRADHEAGLQALRSECEEWESRADNAETELAVKERREGFLREARDNLMAEKQGLARHLLDTIKQLARARLLPAAQLQDTGASLGEGAFATVQCWLLDGREVAVKPLQAEDPEAEEQPEDWEATREMQELALHASLDHPHIIPFLGVAALPDGRLGMVLERAASSLKQRLAENRETGAQLPLPWIHRAARQLAAALVYLHNEAGVIHLDIKSDNLLLTAGDELKVADFGISARYDRVCANWRTPMGYRAPELAMRAVPTTQADAYSFGLVVYEMLTGLEAFPSGEALASEARPQFTAAQRSRWPALAHLADRCMAANRMDRLAMDQVPRLLEAMLVPQEGWEQQL